LIPNFLTYPSPKPLAKRSSAALARARGRIASDLLIAKVDPHRAPETGSEVNLEIEKRRQPPRDRGGRSRR
jgi:hypothetical protein